MKNWDEQAEQIMVERFGRDTVISLATVKNETPYVRQVNAYYEHGAFYVITSALSGKMQQIRSNPAVAIAGEWFTGHGKGMSLGWFGKLENAEIAGKLRNVFAAWIDNGHNDFDDQNTVILCIELTDRILLSHGTRYEI
ncbi:MAG: pyridoxamine 5'-phosphate oxidase family protein [Clostridia bacterium]|nr:pyridoxamine 5'-phosphate oxidase family protein [Clostridia bacterium]